MGCPTHLHPDGGRLERHEGVVAGHEALAASARDPWLLAVGDGGDFGDRVPVYGGHNDQFMSPVDMRIPTFRAQITTYRPPPFCSACAPVARYTP